MPADQEFEMESCRACRGSGKVISNLGGSPSEVECPWCEGSGRFLGSEHDAQAHRRSQEGGEASEAPEPAVDG